MCIYIIHPSSVKLCPLVCKDVTVRTPEWTQSWTDNTKPVNKWQIFPHYIATWSLPFQASFPRGTYSLLWQFKTEGGPKLRKF